VALAKGNLTKVHTLCSQIGGNHHTTWNRDIDRMAPDSLIEELSARTLVPEQRIRESSLRHLVSLIDVDTHPNGIGRWLLPLGIWHRKRLDFGVQYCPVCLRLEHRPYFRRSWRLAYYTECEHHGILLNDRCPSCKSPVDYFRGELGSRSRIVGPKVGTCTHCGFDLGYAMPSKFHWPSWEITVATRTLMLMNDFGWATLENKTFTPAHELLQAIRQLISVMSSKTRAGQLYDAVAEMLWPEGYSVLPDRGRIYEMRGVKERHLLFGMATWLLMDWPSRFEAVVAQSGIHRHSLTATMTNPPSWYFNQAAPVLRPVDRARKRTSQKTA
jgi:hypothetical protein